MSRRSPLRPSERRRLRKVQLEKLESRQLLAADMGIMQNPFDPADVNDDGQIGPPDALMVLNRVRRGPGGDGGQDFPDVNGDGAVTTIDALGVLNRLNRDGGPGPARRGGRGPGDRGDGGGDIGQPPPPPLQLIQETADGGYSVDGSGNNADNPEWGQVDEQLLRLTTPEYADGISEPAGADRPSARVISNEVAAQEESTENARGLTDITWLFGQFIDHDIDLTEGGDPEEAFNIQVPAGDPWFDPFGTGAVEIGLNRSIYDPETGDSVDNPRQQINQITPYIDAGLIYGNDDVRALELRELSGGRLKTSEGDLLPFNEAGLHNAGGESDTLFLAGDIRANENAALAAMHTLWVREHNFWADRISGDNPSLTDEEVYQMARGMVTAELQAITFNEFLPALLGRDAIDQYDGYDAAVDPQIATVFSTAAYRFGHSMLSSEILRLNPDGSAAEEGNISLLEAFFNTSALTENGIDSILMGVTQQVAQEVDTQVVDDVRNFLFGLPGAGGLDLASLNIQRGRDHGLADYNQTRVDMGLDPVTSFSEITSDAELAAKLEALYGDVDNIDVWVGGLSEDHVAGGSMGELFTAIVSDQFERIRDGDSRWYQNIYRGEMLQELETTRLSDIIARNTENTDVSGNVFVSEPLGPPPGGGNGGGGNGGGGGPDGGGGNGGGGNGGGGNGGGGNGGGGNGGGGGPDGGGGDNGGGGNGGGANDGGGPDGGGGGNGGPGGGNDGGGPDGGGGGNGGPGGGNAPAPQAQGFGQNNDDEIDALDQALLQLDLTPGGRL